MPDIFISYKQEERDVASRLATRLTEAGYDVWWDEALLAGERFEDEITQVLTASRVVIILWSRKAIVSDWVKAEAETARQQKKALPAVIDDLPPTGLPLLFRGLHVAQLKDWNGDDGHPGFEELMKSVSDRLGAASGPALSATQAEAKLAEGINEAEIWSAISAGNDPSADEYRAYLRRFGINARFADLAHIRIARIEKREQGAAAAPPPPAPTPAPAPKPKGPGWSLSTRALIALIGIIVIGGGAYFVQRTPAIMNTINGMFIPQATKDAAANCSAWAISPKLDWNTGVPKIDPATTADCTKALTGFPQDGNYLGMLALARIEQGSTHADEAISLANRGVAANGAMGYFALATMYEHGVNLPVDAARAITYYKNAADLALPRAAAKLCLIGIDLGVPPSGLTTDDLRRYCASASDAGDALGQVAAGYILEAGYDGHTVDYSGAAELYRKAADQGNPDGQLALGSLYQRGLGVDRDWARALTLFGAAADTGYPEALRRLAIMYELGQGTPADVNHASQLYETASIRGDLVALFLAGYGIAPTIVATQRLTREMERLADDSTNAVGQRMLGRLYERGYLRTSDFNLAQQQYQLCSDAGNAMCEVALGYLRQTFFYDSTQAIQLYQKAADTGNLYGQYWLAYMYDYAVGVARDETKLLTYYRLAAAQGHLTSINRLAQLDQAPASAK